LQVHIRATDIIRCHAGGRIGIHTDHFFIPLFLFIAASALPSGRLIMVFDLTLPGFSGKFLLGLFVLG
jgi:hypothetical protein